MHSFSFKTIFKKFVSFRNIATCAPSQNLFDDIISPKHFSKLQQHELSSSNINHSQKKTCRPFQYGNTGLTLYVFEKLNWCYSRFNQGNRYGVWYGSLEEDTSIWEIIYHRLAENKELWANPKITSPFIVHQRIMFQATCNSTSMVDLMSEKEMYLKLVSDNYSFCNKLGEWATTHNVDGFFTPSARKKDGICTPLFNPAIIKDEFLYYFDLIIHRNFKVEFKKSEIKQMEVPKEWR